MIESLNLLRPESNLSSESGNGKTSQRIFAAALTIGILLRLLIAFVGDIGPGGDGVQRLWLATDWARNPRWQGLSGVWPPTHWYFLGSLIRLWNEPIFWAKTVNFLCGAGSIIVFRAAVRTVFGDLIASVAALILAIFWTHIWLTTAYWVELPYILLVFLSVHFATRGLSFSQTNFSENVKPRDAFLSGAFLAIAMLLRHEGLVLFALFGLWHLMNVRRFPVILAFALLPLCVSLVHFVEPALKGQSYFQTAAIVKSMKADENVIQGFTLIDCLKQWITMPAVVPSLFVVLPGLYGLWKARRLIRYDLFSWIFISHVGLFMVMTFTSDWRPQLRYIMLYFVNMLPYAALAWVQIMQRFPKRPVLTTLAVSTILLQSFGWWVGRNERRPLGWLPLQVKSASQIALDSWLPTLIPATGHAKVVSLAPGNLEDPWSLVHSTLVNNVDQRRLTTLEIYMPEEADILKGNLPTRITEADAILIDPAAIYYKTIVNSLHKVQSKRQQIKVNQHIIAYVTPQFRQAQGWPSAP